MHQDVKVRYNKHILTKVSEIRDQLKAIGDEVPDMELVTISLNGLPISWEPFIQSICKRKKLSKFDDQDWTYVIATSLPNHHIHGCKKLGSM